jgi:hypothetical protein
VGVAEDRDAVGRQIGLTDDAGADGVVYVMVDVGDAVGIADDDSLQRVRLLLRLHGEVLHSLAVAADAVADLIGEVEPLPVLFEHLHHAQALLGMVEAGLRVELAVDRVEGGLADVAEGGVAEIVAQRDRLGEVLVEAQGAADGAGDLGDLEGVGETGAIVVGVRGDEDLGLVGEAAEGLAVDDAIAVALEGGADGAGGLGAVAAAAAGAPRGEGGERLVFELFALFAGARHFSPRRSGQECPSHNGRRQAPAQRSGLDDEGEVGEAAEELG